MRAGKSFPRSCAKGSNSFLLQKCMVAVFEVIKVGKVTTENIVKTPHTKPVTLDELPTQYFGRNVDGQRGPGGAGKERGLD